MKLIAREGPNDDAAQRMREHAIANALHAFSIVLAPHERQSVLDDVAAWPRASWFERRVAWRADGSVTTLLVIGTDCPATAAYLKLRYG